MALQSSGAISMSQIYAEVTQTAHNGSTSISLNNIGLTADQYGGGFNTTNPDSMSEFYGWAYYYPPTVSFGSITNVTSSQMTLSGQVTSWGSETPDDYGFYMGTNTTCTSNTRYAWTGSQGVSTFNNTFTGLSASTTYYFCAFVKSVNRTEVVTSTYSASTNAATVCAAITSSRSTTSGQAACTATTRDYRYDSNSFSSATKIYAGTDTTCTGSLLAAGYFSDGVIWRYWSGTAFTSSGNCTL